MQKGKKVVMDSCMELSKLILGLKYICVKSSKVVDVWAKTCFPLVLLREGNKCEREHSCDIESSQGRRASLKVNVHVNFFLPVKTDLK